MAKKLTRGLFITFEGPEGCGKSTQSRRVYEELLSDGYEAICTVEPGDTSLGRRIRDILLEKEDVMINKQAELFLFEADRAQHVEEVICPALEARKIVICDRFNTATFAYQGYGLGMDMDLVKKVDAIATGGLRADMTILLDIDVVTGLGRANADRPADKMEKRGREFHEKVRQGYLAVAKKDPDKFKVIEVRENRDETYNLVREEVYGLIARY